MIFTENDIVSLADGWDRQNHPNPHRVARVLTIIDETFMTIEYTDNGDTQLVAQLAAKPYRSKHNDQNQC